MAIYKIKLPRACVILDSKLVVFGEMPFIHILIVIKQCHVTCDGNKLGLPVHTNTDKFVIDHSMTIKYNTSSREFIDTTYIQTITKQAHKTQLILYQY
jgi:hypothetical protein